MGKRNPNVSTILQRVHQDIKNRYQLSGKAEADAAQAKILQDFLQILKRRAFNRKTTPTGKAQEDIYDMILDGIVLPNGRTINNLFQRQRSSRIQGIMFEDDMGAVIASVINLANPDKKQTTYKTYSLGAKVGTTDLSLVREVEEYCDNYVQDVANVTVEQLQKNKPGFVFGKIDTIVNGRIVNMNNSIEFPPGVLEALSNATFTDKSYRSATYRNGEKINLGEREIHLGKSNPYRAVLGTMSYLGYSKADTQYIYYAGKNIVEGLDTDPVIEDGHYVGSHIYHLRYIYELTGAGILYRDYGNTLSQGAKFLVYNDPSSLDITVVSTYAIIKDLLDRDDYTGNPYGNISISTAAVKAMGR